jgi:GNAT superfamily N-acetyltransferase
LFHPITFDEFKLVLGDAATALTSELIRIAFNESGQAVAFIYATQEGTDTAVIKTLAVVPGHRGTGVGSALVAQIHQIAKKRGLTKMIHALMRDGGPSTRISAKGGSEIYRRYQVMELRL